MKRYLGQSPSPFLQTFGICYICYNLNAFINLLGGRFAILIVINDINSVEKPCVIFFSRKISNIFENKITYGLRDSDGVTPFKRKSVKRAKSEELKLEVRTRDWRDSRIFHPSAETEHL